MILLEAGILTLNATFVAQLLVFLVTLAVLYRVAWGPVLRALDARRARIQEGIEAAEQAKRDREAAERERQAELEQARREAQAMLEQATRMGEAVREDYDRRAKEEYTRILERARADIERERQTAMQQLRAQVTDLALRAAERVIGETLDAQKHKALIERTIEEAELHA